MSALVLLVSMSNWEKVISAMFFIHTLVSLTFISLLEVLVKYCQVNTGKCLFLKAISLFT